VSTASRNDGWELILVTADGTAVFKRELRGPDDEEQVPAAD